MSGNTETQKKLLSLFAWIGWLIISVILYAVIFLVLLIFYPSADAAHISFKIWLYSWVFIIVMAGIAKIAPKNRKFKHTLKIDADIDTVWKIMTDPKIAEKVYDNTVIEMTNNKEGQEEWKFITKTQFDESIIFFKTVESIKNNKRRLEIKNSQLTSYDNCPSLPLGDETTQNFILGEETIELFDLDGKTKVISSSFIIDNSSEFIRLLALIFSIFSNPCKSYLVKYKAYIESL